MREKEECWNGCAFVQPYGWVPEADCPIHDSSPKHEAILAEFGMEEGKKILCEQQQIEDHCRRQNIKHHSVNESGFCNMGCC